MNVESFLPCSSSMSKQKRDIREAGKAKELDKPGQSNRELNPYWKDGGDGLPRNDMEKHNSSQIMDANWLRKSLRRAEEQALRDNKSLEEVAAERWGSLETIQSMIAKAEKMSSAETDKSNYKRYYNDKNNQDLHRNSDSEIKNYLPKSSSSSRTRSHENERYKTSNYRSRYVEQQQTYQKPKDDNNDDFFNQTTAHKFSSNRIKNWKKDKTREKKCETISELDKPSEKTDVANPSKTNEEEKNESILTEAEMNKLGARIIKAELMGDDELAAELKDQLEQARKVASNTNVQDKSVTRRNLDAEDIARPIQLGSQSKHTQFSKGYRNKFNFQYCLLQSTNEMDDIDDDVSDQQNALKKAKRFKEDCTYASKKHQDLSKYVDNCWWCLDSKNILKHMIVTMDSMICLSLPAHTSLTTHHCILTPTQHVACQLQLDEDVWERLKVTLLFITLSLLLSAVKSQKRDLVYKTTLTTLIHRYIRSLPMALRILISTLSYCFLYRLIYKALSECEMEWSVNKKIVDLKHKNIRHAVPNGLSYFIVEFASHPGYAHVIEDEETFPKNFAEEIIGGMLDLNCNLWRKPKRQSFDEQRLKVLEFTELWTKYNPLCS
ncbi:CWF19-like protein [Ooceraea biroi]|uniref:CWF19-like protein n=1 Tax=Ooceraea biroi TaxID=2015173 RepID=A0A026W5N9_OOCBI|nr:CWF19-like protein [Ooceraea biroi]